ncbi:hypothetical protein DFA_02647 [Cavenderia fasciculata]|uniref:SAM domain-containing protein n=1 Tax=Cavenderia fasciculata TaxID=261658 RepID=F4PZZ4_CACFS|nr:uncharacterized protein DFA_02647 [Cavenderia fasciculata]EGG18908.1 hypothetical protein DFA_02647 [Cavenderia fasciculata]|eukprot:XP_004357370.1 hypothetical protein DFA_02647 [Cavenderia fasciculata]
MYNALTITEIASQSDFKRWSAKQVKEWATKEVQVREEYAQMLLDNDVDGESIAVFTEADFSKCGIVVAPAKKLYLAVQQLLIKQQQSLSHQHSSSRDNPNPIQDKSKTWEQWNIEEVYGWAKNQSDGEDYAQALKDQSIKGQFLKNLTFARLTQSDGPYKFKDGSAYSLLESIEKLTKSTPADAPQVCSHITGPSLASLLLVNPSPTIPKYQPITLISLDTQNLYLLLECDRKKVVKTIISYFHLSDPNVNIFWNKLNMAEIVEEAVKQKVSLGESTLDSDSTICCLKLSESLFPTKREKYNKIYVRDCYIPVYDIISNHQALHGQGSIVLVKGNPGIGKSVFLFYYLYRKRRDPLVKSIIYDVVDAPVYHFTYTEDGSPIVHQGDRSSFKDILLRPDSSSLYLVDGQRPLPSKRPTLIVSSPNKSNYEEEYMKMLKADTLDGVEFQVLDKISVSDQGLLVNAISCTDLEACVSSINMPDSPQSGSHKVIHLDVEPNCPDFSVPRVSFASNYVKEKMVQRFYWNWREEVIKKISLVGTTQIGGLLFEQLSHQTLSNGGRYIIRSLEEEEDNLCESHLHFFPTNFGFVKNTAELVERRNSDNRFPPETYVRPTDLNFPAIDSFAGKYLFQITKTNQHPVSFKELTHITYNLDPLTPIDPTKLPTMADASTTTTTTTADASTTTTTADTSTTTADASTTTADTSTTTADASTKYTTFHLIFVVPPERFESFPRQDYVELKTQTDPNGKKSSTKTRVKGPRNVRQYALQMVFTSIPASELYPVGSDVDNLINCGPNKPLNLRVTGI